MTYRIGSLCSGYEGLGMAVAEVLGGELAFVADIDPGACKILAHRFPDVPNLGDITEVRWATWAAIGRPDVLTAGFPCQDVSCAGARKGLRAGNRTGVWAYVAKAIGTLRPPLVVLENVRGLLSAGADSPVEPCPWCLGDQDIEHALRALGAVLGDLADLGYDAEWATVSAADAGAPHRRERVFIVARPAADTNMPRTARLGGWGREDAEATAGLWAGIAERRDDAEDTNRTAGDQRRLAGSGETPGWRPRADAGRPGGAHAAADADSSGREGTEPAGPRPGREAAAAVGRRPADEHRPAPANADLEYLGPDGRAAHGDAPVDRTDSAEPAGSSSAVAWGTYEPAIRRWEHVTGRPAPRPTEPGRTGERLSPVFVEWMMGLPAGWVTDVPGLSRNAQLKALGNGVVPAQAALALRLLLADALLAGAA